MRFRFKIKPVVLNKPFPNTARWEGADIDIEVSACELKELVAVPSIDRVLYVTHEVLSSFFRPVNLVLFNRY